MIASAVIMFWLYDPDLIRTASVTAGLTCPPHIGDKNKTYVKSFNKSNPLSNYNAGSSPQRKNALNELNEFMSKPTSSPRQVTQKLKDLKWDIKINFEDGINSLLKMY